MRTIYFVGKKYNHLSFIIDDEDYDFVSQYRWFYQKRVGDHTYYVATKIKSEEGTQRTVRLHRLLLGLQPGDPRQADHRDGHGWNNCRPNLRICTRSQNAMNQRKQKGTSKYKGVYFHRRAQQWEANFIKEGSKIYLGLFSLETDAALAYNDAVTEHFGEFALLNEVGLNDVKKESRQALRL